MSFYRGKHAVLSFKFLVHSVQLPLRGAEHFRVYGVCTESFSCEFEKPGGKMVKIMAFGGGIGVSPPASDVGKRKGNELRCFYQRGRYGTSSFGFNHRFTQIYTDFNFWITSILQR